VLSEFTSWDLVERLPELMAMRTAACKAVTLPSRLFNGLDHVVIAPTGASLYSALMIAELTRTASPIPVFVSRGYDVPKWVGARTLFIAVSKSGRDEELIYSIAAAGDQGARCMAISGGSHLHEISVAQGYPEYTLTEEDDHPALEIAGTFAALWCALAVTVQWSPSDLDALHPILTAQRDLMSDGSDHNPASMISGVLGGKTAHFYGSNGIGGVVSQVWSHLLHRATGKPAFFGSFPGIDEAPKYVNFGMDMSSDAVVLLLRDAADDDLMRERIDRWVKTATEGDLTGRVHEIIAEGATPLERMWSTVHLGIWAACWAAV